MKLQELLISRGIDLERTKLIRHNISNKDIAAFEEIGYLEIYQTIQSPSRFKNCDTVISFLGTEGTNGVLLGCYRVKGFVPCDTVVFPPDFVMDFTDCVSYNLEKTDILADLQKRLVIDWGKGAINWCQNATTEKEILEIRRSVSDIEFPGYDRVVLTYKTLHKIVYNRDAYKKWENKLSAVAGIYLITDTKTGKHYVGSASGLDGGIWGRWSEYARTKHGGNKRLIALIADDPNYCYNFQYSILEILPLKQNTHDILACEKLYKQKLQSIRFGLNDN